MSRSYRADDRYTTTPHTYDPACDCRRCQHQEQPRLGQATREPSTSGHGQEYRLTIGGQVQTFHVRHSNRDGGW